MVEIASAVIVSPIKFLLQWDKGTLEAKQKAEDEGLPQSKATRASQLQHTCNGADP